MWRDNSADFYDSLLNIFTSLGYTLSLGCIETNYMTKRLLQTTTKRGSSMPINCSSDYIIKEGQKPFQKRVNSQDITSDFYDSLANLAAIEYILLTPTKDISEGNLCSNLGQQDMMFPRQYNSLFHSYNSSTLSSKTPLLITRTKDRFMMRTHLSLGQPNTPFHIIALHHHVTTWFGIFQGINRREQQEEGVHSIMTHITACMNLDIAKQNSILQLFLHDFGTSKNSSVWKIGLKIAIVREIEFVDTKISPLLTHLPKRCDY